MQSRTGWHLILLTLALSSVACDKAQTGPDSESAPTEQRRILNEGYSMLYYDSAHLKDAKLILLIKSETDAVNQIVTDISDYGGQVAKTLERAARDYPAVRIDLDPLPEMEKRKRVHVTHDRAFSFMPITGRTGGDFERTLLLSMSAIVSQESHMCKVMADEEPDPGLKKVLLDSKHGYDLLYDRVVTLLNRDYFKGSVSQPEHH